MVLLYEDVTIIIVDNNHAIKIRTINMHIFHEARDESTVTNEVLVYV